MLVTVIENNKKVFSIEIVREERKSRTNIGTNILNDFRAGRPVALMIALLVHPCKAKEEPLHFL